jgi:hypothetical protein
MRSFARKASSPSFFPSRPRGIFGVEFLVLAVDRGRRRNIGFFAGIREMFAHADHVDVTTLVR